MNKQSLKEKIPFNYKKIYHDLVVSFRRFNSKQRALPTFIIIGVQKGGTSSLFSILEQHPQIGTSVFKEVHYYDFDYKRGQRWYQSYFPIKNDKYKAIGEASPYYIFHPKVAERIYKDNPNVKLIALLRDPIDRAYSHYQMERRKGKESEETFEAAIAIETERLKPEIEKFEKNQHYQSPIHQNFSYLSRGKYDEQLEHWYQFFSKEQLLVLKSEDFFENPVSILKEVYRFLEVEEILPKDLKPKNQGKYLPLKASILEKLAAYYQPHIKKLNTITGKVIDWGTKESSL